MGLGIKWFSKKVYKLKFFYESKTCLSVLHSSFWTIIPGWKKKPFSKNKTKQRKEKHPNLLLLKAKVTYVFQKCSEVLIA